MNPVFSQARSCSRRRCVFLKVISHSLNSSPLSRDLSAAFITPTLMESCSLDQQIKNSSKAGSENDPSPGSAVPTQDSRRV